MGDRGEDMQQRTTDRIRTRVAVFRTGPIWCAFYPGSHLGIPLLFFCSSSCAHLLGLNGGRLVPAVVRCHGWSGDVSPAVEAKVQAGSTPSVGLHMNRSIQMKSLRMQLADSGEND